MNQRRPALTRIADAVAGELETRILEGSLKPGDRLPAERELALELGVSRPSLREAIQKLAAKGLLTTRHGGGTVVTDQLDAAFVDPWQRMLSDHPQLHGDLLEFRHMLESEAARLAAERATDADIRRLDAALAALDVVYAGNNASDYVNADLAFHQVVAEAAHNVMIGHLTACLLRVVHGHIARNVEHLNVCPRRWDELQVQHHAIWRAIRERKPDEAAAAARAHIDFVRRSMADTALDEARRHSALRRLGEAA